jgi:hypothetical protein
LHRRSIVSRVILSAFVVLAMATTSTHGSAQDKELTEATDFRVRVQAALRLGRQGGPQARRELEKGLHDAHPAVRVACAVALGNMGDAAAIGPLEQASRHESIASVKTAMHESVAKLRGRAASPSVTIENAKYVVQLGHMRNSAAKDRSDLDSLMRQTAKAKAGTIKNTVIVDSSDSAAVQRAARRKIPVLLVDGTLSRLSQKSSPGGGVIVTAQVDLSIRKVPQQTLKGTVSGNASAFDDSRANRRALQELQNRAVNGAVESAFSSVGSEIASLAK